MCKFCTEHGEGKKLHLEKCFGCGVCRATCPNNAIDLIPPAQVPDAAELWL